MNKKYHSKDPHYAQEANKYENPLPSRAYIMSELADYGRPISRSNLYELLELNDPEQQEALVYRLKAMLRDGQLIMDRRKRYCLVDKIELLQGVVIGHPDGYGFVNVEGKSDDIFLSAKQMRAVFPGDRVLVREQSRDRRGRREGIIHEVIERKTTQVIGRFCFEQGIAYVEPDNKRITRDVYIPANEVGDAKSGQFVVAAIISQPSLQAPPTGRIIEVLGDHMAPGMETDVAIRSYQLPFEWPEAVEKEIAAFSETVPQEAMHNRADCQHLNFVTIDGEDARDFDDAVYCERRARGGWRLLVAIADVSHYVQKDSALDKEALNRGNSVYFPQRVIPMLPEILSNGLCSLKPKVPRLALVCEMSISARGRVTRSRFFHATICSKARLTYTDVSAMLEHQDAELYAKYADVAKDLDSLYELYKVLHQSRVNRGAIEFDTTETRILFDENKKIAKIVPVVRNDAHRLIEECMLLANVCAAKFILKHDIPALFRIHPTPAPDKVKDLREFLGGLGLQLKGGRNPKPKDYVDLLENIKGRADAHLIQTVLLRSLSQAVYDPDNSGHFGLAYDAYTHFTSPIRRYPDLQLHRAITHILNHQDANTFGYDHDAVDKLGKQCSHTERRADEATRDVVDWLKCEYMLDNVGGVFDGIIASVTSFGLFVEIKDIYVEGLVHITALDNDYYRYDSVRHLLQGERSGKIYRLGDPIKILVARVDLDDRKIDFVLA